MPKKNILVQTGTRMETHERQVPDIDEEGNYLGEKTETYEVEVPVFEAQNVEMTAEEIAETEEAIANAPELPAMPETRLDDLENALMELAALQEESQTETDEALMELAALAAESGD